MTKIQKAQTLNRPWVSGDSQASSAPGAAPAIMANITTPAARRSPVRMLGMGLARWAEVIVMSVATRRVWHGSPLNPTVRTGACRSGP